MGRAGVSRPLWKLVSIPSTRKKLKIKKHFAFFDNSIKLANRVGTVFYWSRFENESMFLLSARFWSTYNWYVRSFFLVITGSCHFGDSCRNSHTPNSHRPNSHTNRDQPKSNFGRANNVENKGSTRQNNPSYNNRSPPHKNQVSTRQNGPSDNNRSQNNPSYNNRSPYHKNQVQLRKNSEAIGNIPRTKTARSPFADPFTPQDVTENDFFVLVVLNIFLRIQKSLPIAIQKALLIAAILVLFKLVLNSVSSQKQWHNDSGWLIAFAQVRSC